MNGSNSNTSGRNVATIAVKAKTEGDCLSDSILAEIQRRLEVTLEGQSDSDIWSGTSEPSDKTLIWWPTDPVTGTRTGQPKTYNTQTGTWVTLGESQSYVPPQRRTGSVSVSAGDPVVNIPFAEMPSVNYSVSLTFTRYVGGTWLAAPADLDTFGWVLLNKTRNLMVLQVFNAPSGGLTVEFEVQEAE